MYLVNTASAIVSAQRRGEKWEDALSFNQVLDPLLEVGGFDWELELLKQRGDELVVRQRLPRLHHTNNRGVHRKRTVGKHLERSATNVKRGPTVCVIP